MPRKSAFTIEAEAREAWMVEKLIAIVNDPSSPKTAIHRSLATLRGIDKKHAEAHKAKSAKVNARRSALKAEKAEAVQAETLRNWLPKNNRLDPNFKPAAPASDVDTWPDLGRDQQGLSADYRPRKAVFLAT
jgi:hypothetical protein